MCRNPFGLRKNKNGELESNPRFDKMDIFKDILDREAGGVHNEDENDFAVMAEKLKWDIHNYLYWGLGRNGCTDTKWQEAHDYFFVIRSDKPETWGPRTERQIQLIDGKRVSRVVELTDEDMQQRCFDKQYQMMRLDRVLPMSKFLAILREWREDILTTNREQVETYLRSLRKKEARRVPPGAQLKFRFTVADFVKALTTPEDINQLVELVFPFQLPNPENPRPCRSSRRTIVALKPRRFSRRRPKNQGSLIPNEKTCVGHSDHCGECAPRSAVSVQAP
jgi:hypothetical protein